MKTFSKQNSNLDTISSYNTIRFFFYILHTGNSKKYKQYIYKIIVINVIANVL